MRYNIFMPKKPSFFERLTGGLSVDDEPAEVIEPTPTRTKTPAKQTGSWSEDEEGQLTLDVFQTGDEIVIQAFVAGVRLDDLDVAITQDKLTIRGKRENTQEVHDDNYFYQELYWGGFSRSVLLPEEVDVDSAQATMKTGLLTIRLKKLDRARVQKLRVKNE